jgi:hypothetical protein
MLIIVQFFVAHFPSNLFHCSFTRLPTPFPCAQRFRDNLYAYLSFLCCGYSMLQYLLSSQSCSCLPHLDVWRSAASAFDLTTRNSNCRELMRDFPHLHGEIGCNSAGSSCLQGALFCGVFWAGILHFAPTGGELFAIAGFRREELLMMSHRSSLWHLFRSAVSCFANSVAAISLAYDAPSWRVVPIA